MLENRSFEHLFAYSGLSGLQGIDTSKTNPDKAGHPVALSSGTPNRLKTDLGHEFEDVDWQIYGTVRSAAPRPVLMNGFANKDWPEAMACARPALVPNLIRLAQNFLVCDHWFSSMPGPTWPNRFFVHAASSGGLANSPSNPATIGSMLWRKLGFSFEHGTLFDALEKAGRSWRVYHGDHFPQVCAIDNMPAVFVASSDKFRKTAEFADDMTKGDVANYTFIEPDYGILSSFWSGNSQHPSGALSAGESLIQEVANAVMASPAWDECVLMIVYDEHGGFYDQEHPPTCQPPGDKALNQDKSKHPPNPNPPFDFKRLGVRVPAVVVSPWVKPGSLSHTVYDHASVVRTVFELFGLPGNLTDRDAPANTASLVPLLKASGQAPALKTMPSVTVDTAPPPEMTGPVPPSLDGFTRIAAQVDHALRRYQASMPPYELQAAIDAVDEDLRYLPGVPKSDSPEEARVYIAEVAARLEAHRLQQRAGLTP